MLQKQSDVLAEQSVSMAGILKVIAPNADIAISYLELKTDNVSLFTHHIIPQKTRILYPEQM